MLRIPAHEMYAQPKATQKLLEDASINVETWLSNKISDKFGRLEATAFIVGTGVKMPCGLLTYPAGTTNPGQIDQIHSGHANLVTAASLIRISFSVKEPYMANERFLMQRSAVASVTLLKDTQQRYLWQPSYTASQPASLVGYPIAWAADMPAIAAGATLALETLVETFRPPGGHIAVAAFWTIRGTQMRCGCRGIPSRPSHRWLSTGPRLIRRRIPNRRYSAGRDSSALEGAGMGR